MCCVFYTNSFHYNHPIEDIGDRVYKDYGRWGARVGAKALPAKSRAGRQESLSKPSLARLRIR